MSKPVKTLLTAIGIILLLVIVYYAIGIGAVIYSGFNTLSKPDTDFSNYEMYRRELKYAEEFLPAQGDLASAKDLHFAYQKNFQFIFISKTVAVTVRYTPEEYLKAKEHIAQRYTFLDNPRVYLYSADNEYELDNAFVYKDYDFHVVAYDGCRYFGMIGTSDETHSIAYLYYSDTDRDLIARADEDLDQEMRELIDDEFHWEPFSK